jgi:hypothetical protein
VIRVHPGRGSLDLQVNVSQWQWNYLWTTLWSCAWIQPDLSAGPSALWGDPSSNSVFMFWRENTIKGVGFTWIPEALAQVTMATLSADDKQVNCFLPFIATLYGLCVRQLLTRFRQHQITYWRKFYFFHLRFKQVEESFNIFLCENFYSGERRCLKFKPS